MDFGIEGKVALVTAASKGIGRAIAAELVREGARVAISSRSAERTEATAREIGATPLVWDSADLDAIPGLLDDVARELGGPVQILVTNTGGPPPGGPLDASREEWEAAYRTLVLAPLELAKAALPAMREQGWGRIVNVGSTSVLEPIDGLMLSNTHRAGTLAMFKTLSRAVAADGVTLNHVLPGRIATDRLLGMGGTADGVPAGRLGTPEEMASAAAYLCSDRAGYVSGEFIRIDGGLTRSL
jgi:3-oxoacyl-[acyl-carrier protein] reductase